MKQDSKPVKPVARPVKAVRAVRWLSLPLLALFVFTGLVGLSGQEQGQEQQEQAEGSDRFSDVPETHPFAVPIYTAVAEGWFKGYTDGKFRPYKNLTDNQVANVFKRAFPGGLSRQRTARFIVEGKQALQPQSGTGRLVKAELPVIKIYNLPGYISDPTYGRWVSGRFINKPMVDICHIEQEHPDYNTVSNLKSFCNDLAKSWVAEWKYVPEGFDTSNLFVWAEQDGANKKLPFYKPYADDNQVRHSAAEVKQVTSLKPLLVRDNSRQARRPDVLIECVQYPGWSDKPVEKLEDIVIDCYQPEVPEVSLPEPVEVSADE